MSSSSTSTSIHANNEFNNDDKNVVLRILLVGKETSIETSLNQTVGQLCEKLLKIHAPHATDKRVRLIWRGVECSQRNQKLRDYGIVDGSVLHAQISNERASKKKQQRRRAPAGNSTVRSRRQPQAQNSQTNSILGNIRSNLARMSAANGNGRPQSTLDVLLERQRRLFARSQSDERNSNVEPEDLESGERRRQFDTRFDAESDTDEDDNLRQDENVLNFFRNRYWNGENDENIDNDDTSSSDSDSDDDDDDDDARGFNTLRRFGLSAEEIAAIRADFHQQRPASRQQMYEREEEWMNRESQLDDEDVQIGLRSDAARQQRAGTEEDLIIGMLAGFTLSVLALFLVRSIANNMFF